MANDKFNGLQSDIFEYLSESHNSASDAIEKFGLECRPEDIKSLMSASSYKRCPNCGWWVEAFELTPEDEEEPDGYCGNCRVQINE
jgi:hypothetical protein